MPSCALNTMRQAHADGWFIVFDTLTLADDRLEACYDNPNALRDYFRYIGRRVHAAVHSFPTRRSSDLIGGDDAFHGRDHTGLELGGIHLEVVEDRKSTRLNSSHVERSYAVLCFEYNATGSC